MPQEANPFEYVRPLPPGKVTGRADLSNDLLRAVRDRSLVAVIGPRRYGKTSLLGHVAALAAEDDSLPSVTVDCFGVASTGEFAVRLESALDGLHGPGRTLARRLLESSELGLSLAPGVGFKATFGRRNGPDPTAALHGLLSTLIEVANKRDGLLLILDEFQDLHHIAGLDALLRTHLQQARNIAVLFAGSKPSLLRALFTDATRPFYGQARLLDIGPFDVATAAQIIENGFEATGRDPGESGVLVARATAGHPQRLMLVAHHLWAHTPPGGAVAAENVAAALDTARSQTAAEHQAVFDRLDRSHRDALRAVATYGSPYARAATRTLGSARGSIQSAVRALEADTMLQRHPGTWTITDPLLADWLHNRLPLPT
jgi:hypothetical protein